MDRRRAEKVNEAAQKFAEALVGSYRAVSSRAASAQQLNAELTQDFFSSVIGNLRSQAESNREMTRELRSQQERQQEATQTLAQQSVSAYIEFLESVFSYYQGTVESAEPRETGGTIEAAKPASEEPRVQTGDGELPLADYDSLNVREVSERMRELSVEELERLRRYEAANKNRSTLLKRFDDRIEAGA